MIFIDKVETVLKGPQNNFRGICSCLLLTIGIGVQLNTAWAGSAASLIAPGPQLPASTPVMLAAAGYASPGNTVHSRPDQDQSANALPGYPGYDVGPFDAAADVDKVIRFLENRGIKASFSEKDGRQPLGYIVVSQRFSTPTDIRNMMDMLARQGISDVVYVRRGDYAGRISMGVYSSLANARIRQMALQELGIDTDVIQRSRTVSQWWVHLVGEVHQEQVLEQLGELIGSNQLTLGRSQQAPGELQQISQPRLPEISDENADLSAASIEVSEPAISTDAKKGNATAEPPPASQGEPEAEPSARDSPQSIEKTPARLQKDAGPLSNWLIPGLLFLLTGMLAWYMYYRFRVVQPGAAPSALTALVSSTLNERDEGMLVLDDRQLIVLANKAFSRLVGKSSEELKGQKISALGISGEGSESKQALWGSLSDQASARINVRVHLKLANNTYSTFLVSTSPLLTEEGAVSGTIVSFRPILELNGSTEKTDDADQADIYRWSGTEFLKRISPENQLPAEAILRYAELLQQRRPLDPAEQQNFLNTISSGGSRLVNLLGTVLELSKHHSGLYTLEKVAFSPTSLLQDITDTGNRLAAEKGCQLRVEGADNLPDSLISDPQRLRRILQYLSADAIHRSKDGAVILRIRQSDIQAATELQVDIVDQSRSLANVGDVDKYSYLERLAFEDTSYTVGHELDLLIARQLVDELGGTLAVQAGAGGSVCFSLSVPVAIPESHIDEVEDKNAVSEQLFNQQLSRVEALAREEAASSASAEEQVNQERQARSMAQEEARRVTEALLVAEQRAAREAEQKKLLEAKLSAELETRRDLEEQARLESAARLSVEVDLLETARQKEELQAAIARERGERAQLAAKATAEERARRDAEQGLETERNALAQLQARLSEEAEARSQIESSLARERLSRQELEEKLQAQLAASQALSATIQVENQALTDIEAKLETERLARSELEEKLRRESSGMAELTAKMQQEAAARRAAEQTLIREREEKQLLHKQLQAEASARQELAERILAEERARETAQRALEGKRETVLELEEKLRTEAEATAELLKRARAEDQARQLLGQQLQDEQEARARLESTPQIDPQQQATLEEAVQKCVELQQAVAEETAARHQAEQNLALEIDARKMAEAKVETEQQLNLKAQAALEEERQARRAAEQKVKAETRFAPGVQQGDAAPFQSFPTDPGEAKEELLPEADATRSFQVLPAADEKSTDQPAPPLLTDRLEVTEIPEQAAIEFTGNKSRRADFLNRLGEQLTALDRQWESQDLEAFTVTLQWVCQHTELFGVRDILLQANELLHVVETEAFGLVPTKLRYIKRLYARIEGGKAMPANGTGLRAGVETRGKAQAGEGSGIPDKSKTVTGKSDEVVHSTLNVSNPTIQRLVKRSIIRLRELMANMDLCYQKEDLKELVKLCYRLRGEADIAGLKAFVSPARQLEHYVKTGQISRVAGQLQQLGELLARIEMPESAAADLHPDAPAEIDDIEQETVDMEKINSTLNLSSPKLKSRVRQFVVRLGSQLTELDEVAKQKNYDELTRISNWIANYGRVMGFDMVSQLAQKLADTVQARNDQEILDRLEQLRMLFSRIEI